MRISVFAAILFAVTAISAPSTAKVITKDTGGRVEDRAREVAQLRASGEQVEIRGSCMSACTMYLDLPNVCVHPQARLGFHAPRIDLYGSLLPPDLFEYWTQYIAAYYPPHIKRWFLAKGRYAIDENRNDFYIIRGSEIIRMGVKKCERKTK